MSSPQELHDTADEVKQVAVAALNLIPTLPGSTDLEGAPDRALVTPGLPVDDCCAQVAVHVDPVTEDADRAGNRMKAGWINMVVFTVTSGRCIPGGGLDGTRVFKPSVEQLELSARQLNADAWALWNGLKNAHRDGLIFSRCDRVSFGPMQSRNPSGGCGGWTLEITASVQGFNPEIELES